MLSPKAKEFIPKAFFKQFDENELENEYDELEKEIYLNHLQFSYQIEIDKIIEQKNNELCHGFHEYFVNLKYIEILKQKHYEYIYLYNNLFYQ